MNYEKWATRFDSLNRDRKDSFILEFLPGTIYAQSIEVPNKGVFYQQKDNWNTVCNLYDFRIAFFNRSGFDVKMNVVEITRDSVHFHYIESTMYSQIETIIEIMNNSVKVDCGSAIAIIENIGKSLQKKHEQFLQFFE